MQEHPYQGTQENNGGNGLVHFLLGLFMGAAVAAPVTALIVKKVCDGEKKAEIAKAAEEAENRGIQAATEQAQEWIMNHAETPNRAISEPNRGIPEGVSEKEMAERQFPTDDEPEGFDIENYDLRIDDEEATQEAREFSEEHVRYLDMIERYKDSGGNIPPMTISREQFDNEHFYEKCYINWYDGDDVFEENNTRMDDPNYTFGFASGNEMFSPERIAKREDPDICYVRNMKMSTDFEITRTHGTYAQLIQDGEAYYDGETNSQY